MIATALFVFAILAWLRPRYAVGALLFLIPFGHLVRFDVGGIPFTFPESAVYVLAGAMLLRAAASCKLQAASYRAGRLEACSYRLVAPLRDPWVILPLLWILIAAIAAWYSPAGMRAWGIWKAYFVAPVLLCFVIRHLLRGAGASSGRNHKLGIKNQGDERGSVIHDSLFIILPIAAGAAIVAALAIAQRWWPIGVPYPWSLPGRFRATSVFGYPNAVGLFLGPIAVLAFGAAMRLLQQRQQHETGIMNHESRIMGAWRVRSNFLYSLFLILTSAIATVAIALARSTGALIALVVAIPIGALLAWCGRARRVASSSGSIAVLYDRRKGRWCGVRGCAVGIVTAWVAVSLALTAWLPYRHEQPTWGSPIVQKLTFQKWSGSVRLSQYRETWKLLRDHPIRGAGLAGYQAAIAPYHEDPRVEIFLYPHNLLLAVWSELGLAGLLLVLAILCQFFRSALHLYSSTPLPPGIAVAMSVLLIHGLVDVPYFKNDLAMVFWVVVAMGTVVMDKTFANRLR